MEERRESHEVEVRRDVLSRRFFFFRFLIFFFLGLLLLTTYEVVENDVKTFLVDTVSEALHEELEFDEVGASEAERIGEANEWVGGGGAREWGESIESGAIRVREENAEANEALGGGDDGEAKAGFGVLMDDGECFFRECGEAEFLEGIECECELDFKGVARELDANFSLSRWCSAHIAADRVALDDLVLFSPGRQFGGGFSGIRGF